jgi:hypothetical protein
MPVVFENYDQQRMMYVGFYNGMSYFTTDRVFDQEHFEETTLQSRSLQEE